MKERHSPGVVESIGIDRKQGENGGDAGLFHREAPALKRFPDRGRENFPAGRGDAESALLPVQLQLAAG